MAEHQRKGQNNKEDTDRKRHLRQQESQISDDYSHAWEQGQVAITETPFFPRMDEHAELLSKPHSDEQRIRLVLHLQQTYGNRYVQRLIASMRVQTKLTVNAPNDIYEQEADEVARAVTNRTLPQIQRQEEEPEDEEEPEEEIHTKSFLQRQDIPEDEEAQTKSVINRQVTKTVPEVNPEIEDKINIARGSGQPLSETIRKPIERAFGTDFSWVRVHSDSQADTLNRQLSARAFTTGQDIFFREGEYSPGSESGRKLIAHELTHMVQQGTTRVNKSGIDWHKHVAEATLGGGVLQQAVVKPAIDGLVGLLALNKAEGKQIVRHELIQRRRPTMISKSQSIIQRETMTLDEFKQGTFVKRARRKDIAMIDKPLKEYHEIKDKFPEFKWDKLTAILSGIQKWFNTPIEKKQKRKANTISNLKAQVEEELARVGQPEYKGETIKKGRKISDFEGKQYRVSGKAPDRKIEEVKRKEVKGKVTYIAVGQVVGFKGNMPITNLYDEPEDLGDWFPKVTHINGMKVKPEAGIKSAMALQDAVNNAIAGNGDVAFGQDAVDVLYTYSATKGFIKDVGTCIKGKWKGGIFGEAKAGYGDESTERQIELMRDAIKRKQKVYMSAHSRGTIKTDNAVRTVLAELTLEKENELMKAPETIEEAKAYIRAGWYPDVKGMMETLTGLIAGEKAGKAALNEFRQYVQLNYAGNAVSYPKAGTEMHLFIPSWGDYITFFAGTMTKTLAPKGAEKHVVAGEIGHEFISTYSQAVGEWIGGQIK